MSAAPILITNDDGIGAEGLLALEAALSEIGTVWVVAPDREQSAQSHALTVNHPVRIEPRGPRRFAVQGTPTDCVYLAVYHILENRPRLVVSGINKGVNLGDDVTYSGTVSAAFEATLMSVPAFAISQETGEGGVDFGPAARFAASLALEVLRRGLPVDTLLNVNVPRRPPSGVRVTRQGKRAYSSEVIRRTDPKGRMYYWIGGKPEKRSTRGGAAEDPESDIAALQQGAISVTPLHLDLTNHPAIDEVRHWNLTP
jgi:5'-nucleotidase